MNESTTTISETLPETIETPVAPAKTSPAKAKPAKKSPAKASKSTNPNRKEKTVSKTATKKAPAKKAATPKADANGGLRTPQVRILRALAKAKNALSRPQIADKAPVDQASCVEYLGSHDDAIRKANDKKHFLSLVSLGLVRHEQHDIDGRDTVVYSITAAGRAKLEKIAK